MPIQFTLEKYKGIKSRHACPSCNHKLKFTRYVNLMTGEQIADHVGRCNRENNCSYHYTPRQFFTDNPTNNRALNYLKSNYKVQQPAIRPIDYLPFDVFEKSVENFNRSNFYKILLKLFKENVATYLCNKYSIGTNKEGDTVFWLVDYEGNIRQAKVMRFNSDEHRDKQFKEVYAGKKILGYPNDSNLLNCFFGEYLLCLPENSGKPIAIVESQKTAVIASVYLSEYVWLATGGKSGCRWTEKEVCKVLAGKNVILFPDLREYESWKEKGSLLSRVAGCRVSVSTLLEKNATNEEKVAGLDIADYLLANRDNTGLALTDDNYPIIWDYKP